VFLRAITWVVHDSEVHQRAHTTTSENVLGAPTAEIDLVMLDVARAVGERASVQTYHARLPMQHARQTSPEPAANPSDDDRAIVACSSN
jgi:hypothetical protein